MKKTLLTLVLLFILLLLASGMTLGNALTLQAENGKILAPAGLGFELNGSYQSGQESLPLYNAQLAYGITPSITIAGELMADPKKGSDNQILVKALFSPTRESNGYTLYAGYNPNQAKLQQYGISLWTNNRFLYAFANLEARNTSDNGPKIVVTPGADLKIGSRIVIGGEMEYNPENWNNQGYRVGATYYLNPKITAKFTYKTDFNNPVNRTYETGITVEL